MSFSPPTAPTGDDWFGVERDTLPVAAVAAWLVRTDCGATVVFTGTARDSSPGRDGVDLLSYEAYESGTLSRFAEIAGEARRRWPDVGRMAMLHRTGDVALGEAAVLVGAGAPHRDSAFEVARFCIDAVKATAPIWKKERWAGGNDWGLDATELIDPAEMPARGPVTAGGTP